MGRTNKFLDQFIFFDLTDQNTGFDAEVIKHFSKEDFQKVLERVEYFKIGIYGIEIFSEGRFIDVATNREYWKKPNNPRWYQRAFQKLAKQGENLVFSATYTVEEKLLDLFC